MSKKKCPHCNIRLEGNPKFCPECGAPLSDKKPPVDNSSGKKAAGGSRDWLIIGAVVLIISAGYFIIREKPIAASEPEHNHEGEGMTASDITPSMLDQLPDDYPTLIGMGNRFMDEGNFSVAAEIYKRALAIDGSDPDVRSDYGACLYGMDMPERAIEEFTVITMNNPEHAMSRFNLGIVYMGTERPDSARYFFNKYLEIDPQGRAASAAKQYLKSLEG